MPTKCPHCGIVLPAVVDAYCPECREDLSETPDEAQRKAEGTFKVVAGVVNTLTQNRLRETPAAARERSYGYSLWFVLMLVFALVMTAQERKWGAFVVVATLLLPCLIWVRAEHRQSAVKTSVSGREKTSQDSDETK